MEVNAIYEGDNSEIMSNFDDKSVDLIYADPPFYTNKGFEVIWKDAPEIRAFEDRWAGGIEHYITWMEPRLRECHRVLKDTGSFYLHCDWHASAHLRILMDKIFKENNFQNEIIWHYGLGASNRNRGFLSKHDNIYFYTKSDNFVFNKIRGNVTPQMEAKYSHEDKKGKYMMSYGKKYYLKGGKPYDDVWDIPAISATSKERLGYPTQKPVALLERIINASSNKGDIVLDPFCGCGTTLVAAQKLGRRWIGIDISPTACKLMQKRLRKQFGINPPIIRGNVDLNYVKKLNPFEFQNWVVVDKFLGTISPRKSGDFGIDGFTPQIRGGFPIQVKQSDDVGRNVIDNFETAMRRMNKKKGYIVAFSFGKGAVEEVARARNQEDLDIILRTVQDLLDGKIYD